MAHAQVLYATHSSKYCRSWSGAPQVGTGVQKVIKDKEETYMKGSTSEEGGREVLQGRGEGLRERHARVHAQRHTQKQQQSVKELSRKRLR